MIRPPRRTSRQRSRWRRAVGQISAVLGVIVVLAIILVGGLLWYSRPPSEQAAAISGLSAPVSITMDQDGVPRIRAASEIDAAAALGFLHARDRMLELELMRRAASGRLSELVAAPETLRFDREMRVLGLRFRAIAEEAELPAADRDVLQAYARGVNAWISARGRFSAPEFILLGEPEPWQPSDTLLWAKTMGLWLAGNWQQELARLSLSQTLAAERIAELWPRRTPAVAAQTARVDASLDASVDGRLVAKAGQVLAALPQFPEPFTLPSDESNAWTVAGTLSATGHPLLAGDPHLVYSLPGPWYLVRIERPEGVWAGATAPGVPGIVMGRNPRIAWAFTTTGADTQDVFIETPVGDEQYATPDGPRPFTTREERIRVRGQPDVVLKVRETRHGPVINDVVGNIAPEPDGKLLSVAMASLKPGETVVSGFLALNRAGSVAEAGQAAARITSPVQNMLVADAQHIGLFVTGRVPLRRAGDGSRPVEGADGRHDWVGFASGSQLPVTVDPPSGRIVNANEPVAPTDFPTFMGHDPRGPWRAERIEELLAASGRLSVADFGRMQVDAGSTYARQLLPSLRGVAVPEGTARQALAQLQAWDGTMSMDGPQALIFNAWLARFRDDVLSRAGVPEKSPAVSRQDFVAWLLSADAQPAVRAFWCDGPCERMLGKALESATAELAARLGPDPAAWRWGALHRAVFAHPLLRFVPVLGHLTEASAAIAGDTTTINRQEALFGGFDSVHGPSFRAVYDLGDLDRSRFIVAPGQSGNLLSPTARVFLDRWAAGALVELGPDTAGAPVTARLELTPAP